MDLEEGWWKCWKICIRKNWNVSGSVLLSYKAWDGTQCCIYSSLLCGVALLCPWGWEARGAPLGYSHAAAGLTPLHEVSIPQYWFLQPLTKSGWWKCGYLPLSLLLPRARPYILFFHLYLPSQSYVHLPVKLKFVILCFPLMERCLTK